MKHHETTNQRFDKHEIVHFEELRHVVPASKFQSGCGSGRAALRHRSCRWQRKAMKSQKPTARHAAIIHGNRGVV